MQKLHQFQPLLINNDCDKTSNGSSSSNQRESLFSQESSCSQN